RIPWMHRPRGQDLEGNPGLLNPRHKIDHRLGILAPGVIVRTQGPGFVRAWGCVVLVRVERLLIKIDVEFASLTFDHDFQIMRGTARDALARLDEFNALTNFSKLALPQQCLTRVAGEMNAYCALVDRLLDLSEAAGRIETNLRKPLHLAA